MVGYRYNLWDVHIYFLSFLPEIIKKNIWKIEIITPVLSMFIYLLVSEPYTMEESGVYPNETLALRALLHAHLKDPSKKCVIKKVVCYGTIVLDQNARDDWFIHEPKKVIDPRRNEKNKEDKQK
jgi:hypothetical protein